MSANRLSPQTSHESTKPTTNDASANTNKGRPPTSGSLGLKARNSLDSPLPSSKTGQSGRPHSASGPINEDYASHRRYRSKSAHANKFQQLVENSRVRPNGVLAIHIKVAHIHDIDSEGEVFTEGAHLFVYLRILCIDYVKYSRVYVVDDTPTTIVFDELKHFYINVGSMKPDSFCFVRFEVVAFDEARRSVHRVFASKEISLLQIVKCMCGTATLELWRNEAEVAEIEIEACFSTGAFGYGYSSLFDISEHSPKVQLGWSMFCRLPPPQDRTDARHPDSSVDLIACRETARPGILNFTRHALLKPVGQWTRAPEPDFEASPFVGGMIGRRLAQRQVAYSKLRTRQERLQYLREFVIHPMSQAEETLISEDVHYFQEVNTRRATFQTDTSRTRYSIFTGEPDHKTDPNVVKIVAPAMGSSPGVIRRRQVEDKTTVSKDDRESGK